MADRTAWCITSANGWWSAFGKKRGKNGRKAGPPVHDNLCARTDEGGRVRHVFAAESPDELWLTDITEHSTAEGKVYMCAIKDASSGRIVGYSIDSRMKSRLVMRAIENAVAMRGNVAGCIAGSDRGSQFRSRKVLRGLARYKLVGSMGRVGAAGDNAAMESSFALLQPRPRAPIDVQSRDVTMQIDADALSAEFLFNSTRHRHEDRFARSFAPNVRCERTGTAQHFGSLRMTGPRRTPG